MGSREVAWEVAVGRGKWQVKGMLLFAGNVTKHKPWHGEEGGGNKVWEAKQTITHTVQNENIHQSPTVQNRKKNLNPQKHQPCPKPCLVLAWNGMGSGGCPTVHVPVQDNVKPPQGQRVGLSGENHLYGGGVFGNNKMLHKAG